MKDTEPKAVPRPDKDGIYWVKFIVRDFTDESDGTPLQPWSGKFKPWESGTTGWTMVSIFTNRAGEWYVQEFGIKTNMAYRWNNNLSKAIEVVGPILDPDKELDYEDTGCERCSHSLEEHKLVVENVGKEKCTVPGCDCEDYCDPEDE